MVGTVVNIEVAICANFIPKFLSFLFFTLFILCVHACVAVVSEHGHGGQRATCRSPLLFSTVWFPGIKLRPLFTKPFHRPSKLIFTLELTTVLLAGQLMPLFYIKLVVECNWSTESVCSEILQ